MNQEKYLEVFPFRRMEYADAMDRQLQLVEKCIESGGSENFLLPVEHPPVITLGRSADQNDILSSGELLKRRGVKVIETNRGGKITFHGPGQLVIYPIVDLRGRGKDLHRYLRELECWIIELLSFIGLEAYTTPPYTGVWAEGGKIASIGIAVRRWIAYHGVALNVNPDMNFFDHIVPCGLQEAGMVSLESLGLAPASLEEVANEAAELFRKLFGFP